MSADVPVVVLGKVRKLLAKAEATDNPNEADAFAAKAAELIAHHRIDAAGLHDGAREGRLAVRRVPIGRGAYVRGRLALLEAVAVVHDCELVWQSGPDGAVALLAGFDDDLDATTLLYESLHLQAAARMAAVRRSTPAATQRWRRSFLFGYAARIGELLAAARSHAEHDVRATGSTLPDLPARAAQVKAHAASAFGRVVAGAGAEPGDRRRVGPRAPRGRRRGPRTARDRRPAGDRSWFGLTVGDGCAGTDVGREAVYAAEEATFGGTDVDEPRSFSRLVAQATAVTEDTWWQSCRGPHVAVVMARADARSSSARPSRRGVVVRIASGQLTTVTLAHELAHALAGLGEGHDARFRAAHIDVVAVLGSRELAASLGSTYVAHGIPPGVRAWPPPHRVDGPGFRIMP